MHLVQDASVPAHVRNDIHIRYNYESWLEDIQTYEGGTFQDFFKDPISFDKNILDLTPNPLAPIPISRIIDTDQYDRDRDNPGMTVSNAIGIAEYTNANFFSEGTVFSKAFPYPALTSVEKADYLIPHPRDNTKTVTRQYYKKIGDGEVGYRLATVGFLRDYIVKYFKDYTGLERKALDGGVLEDYAKRLLPRAVGYSAGLLKYFFRGELKVSCLPLFFKNNNQYLRLKIKNLTPDEDMKSGHFMLTYRYTPPGKPEDGSQDIFNYAFGLDGALTVPCIGLKSEEETEVYFQIPYDSIPVENLKSLKLTLAFQGMLGQEEKAVVGKVFSPGEVLFHEEWDNGLKGNHPWGHTGIDYLGENPDNGSTGNAIVGDILIKDNIRFRYDASEMIWRRRFNSSFIGLSPLSDQFKDTFPIRITPNTYVLFKIDAMWTNPIPYAPPGYTDHYQGLFLRFNQSLELMFTQPEENVDLGPDVVSYIFPLGSAVFGNLYYFFQNQGIAIPEIFYLNNISFLQQLLMAFETEENSTGCQQHMEVDFIQIIEEKDQ
jgi:hypothetical protein